MTKPIYITEWKDLVGETIDRVYEVDRDDDVCITMASGKRVFITTDGWDDHYPDLDTPSIGHEHMFKAGWMSKEEYDKLEKERLESRARIRDINERAEYERLKEKFGADLEVKESTDVES